MLFRKKKNEKKKVKKWQKMGKKWKKNGKKWQKFDYYVNKYIIIYNYL
jgi:hypothetical protein